MKTPRLTIHAILDSFFEELSASASGTERLRVAEIEGMLRSFLELEGERVLLDQDRAIFEAERSLDPGCAFARTMHADDLVFALTLFVEPRWLHPDLRLRGTQLAVTERLTARILEDQLVDGTDFISPLLEIEAGIIRARAELGIRKPWNGPAANGGPSRSTRQ
jgi:hypothetical protein